MEALLSMKLRRNYIQSFVDHFHLTLPEQFVTIEEIGHYVTIKELPGYLADESL